MSLNFNPRVVRVLDEIERFGLSHDPVQTDRQLKMLNLERCTAELIHVLLLSSARKRVLEIGTSNGFSAIVIGATLQSIEGAVPLTTIERDRLKVAGARTNIAHANLSFIVQVIQGSTTEVIHELAGPFDCVFFDADRLSARAPVASRGFPDFLNADSSFWGCDSRRLETPRARHRNMGRIPLDAYRVSSSGV